MLASGVIGAGLVLAATLSWGVGDASPPASTVFGAGYLQFKTMKDTNFCVDTNFAAVEPAVTISLCSSALSQRFTMSNGADGHNLILDSRGRCLGVGPKFDLVFRTVSDGACKYNAKQRWSFLADGQIVIGNKLLCLTLPTQTASGAPIRLTPCTGSTGQLWKLAQ
jgi:hypothetical protein